MFAKMKSIVICTVVSTARLDCAVINSKPLSHEREKPEKVKSPVKHWNLTLDGWIDVIAQ